MPKSFILDSSDHNTFTQFSSESLANFRRACTCAFLSRGTLRALQDFSPSRRSMLPIVFLVAMVPAALRSLKRSSRVVLGWFLTVLMITETPRGEILHGAPDRGRLTVILCFFHLPIISPTVVTRANPRLLGALCKTVSTGRGVAGCSSGYKRMSETQTNAFHSVSNHAAESTQKTVSLPQLAMLSTHF